MRIRDVSLLPAMSVLVLLIVLVATGAVGLSAYLTSRDIVAVLWDVIAKQTAQVAAEKTEHFLDPAIPFVELSQRRMDTGMLDPDDPEAMLRYLLAALESHPNATWIGWGDESGTYTATNRRQRHRILGTHRVREAATGARADTTREHTRRVEFELSSWDGRRVVDEYTDDYDPRARPWYRSAVDQDGGTWVGPYMFLTEQQPGFSYVAPQRHKDGSLIGVWAVDYELRYLSDFLGGLTTLPGGRVYVITGDGRVVGHPQGVVVRGTGDSASVWTAADHPDTMLANAWAHVTSSPSTARSFAFSNLLATATPLSAAGIDWLVLVVVPRQAVFGAIESQARRALWIGLAAAAAAVLGGLLFARRLSRSVGSLTADMHRMANLEFTEHRFGDRPSTIRELNRIGSAADKMKEALRSFSKYVPREVVGKLLRAGTAAELGGQHATMTVMFADLQGFTSAAESLPPAQLVHSLGNYLGEMTRQVELAGGSVDKYLGDAVMAFWGAPLPLEDHAVRAVRAALAIQTRVRAMNERHEQHGQPAFEVRIGINTGDMVVGNFGSLERLNYTVVGDSVNLAARLESLNKIYSTGILIGEETARQVREAIVLRPLDWVAVRGRTLPELVHEPIGETGNVGDATLLAIGYYLSGLEAYRERRFAAAISAFEEAQDSFGSEDGPTTVLIARCRVLQEQPPADDWNGVHVMGES